MTKTFGDTASSPIDLQTASTARPKNTDIDALQAYAVVDLKGEPMEIQQHKHKHPMILYDLDKEKLTCRQCNTPYELPSYYCPKCQCWIAAYCPGCGESIGGKTWVCKDCYFYVHKSCADRWPPQIHHPFHPLHPLKLHYRSGDFEYISKYTCSACKSSTRCFAYHCAECPFGLCLQCVSTNPKTKFEDGNHILYLFQDTKFERHCDVCDNTDRYAWIFICVVPNCGYAVHIHCTSLALPAQVQHRRDPHPLVLTRDVVGEDGTDEYYCDSCEDRRDLKHPIYYCEECDFISHIGCGISEVLPLLLVEYENDLKTKGPVSDPYLEKIDEELKSLRAKEEEVRAKLESLSPKLKALEDERAQYLASSIESSCLV